MPRYLTDFVKQDLKEKMVFIGGPRQVGKTTLCKDLLLNNFPGGEYFTWDNERDRKAISGEQWSQDSPLIVLDELHKMPRWKRWIKGVFDVRHNPPTYLVTGSARLDVYRRGGDSLMGRYHYWRLHPFTLDELPSGLSPEEGYRRLLSVGGFPEPFLKDDERSARRWRRQRLDRVIKEDVRDLEQVRNIPLLERFAEALRTRVGSTLVLSNLARDIEISPNTAKAWLSLLENMYLAFAIYPYTAKISRSIQKPPKVFFFDNGDIENNEGARLENLVATTLLKRLHFIQDYYGYRCSLHYIRDKDGREVDFVTIIDGKAHELIEAKLSETEVSSSLKYYTQLLKPSKAVQLVGNLTRSFDTGGIRVTHPTEYFRDPPWMNLK